MVTNVILHMTIIYLLQRGWKGIIIISDFSAVGISITAVRQSRFSFFTAGMHDLSNVKSWYFIGMSVPKLQPRALFLICRCTGVVVSDANSKHIVTESPVCAICWSKQVMRATLSTNKHEIMLFGYILELHTVYLKLKWHIMCNMYIANSVKFGEKSLGLPTFL